MVINKPDTCDFKRFVKYFEKYMKNYYENPGVKIK